jgi:hypothetical protein
MPFPVDYAYETESLVMCSGSGLKQEQSDVRRVLFQSIALK